MAVERRNPLPVGWYWYELPTGREAEFHAWREPVKTDAVVRKTQVDESTGSSWFLFEVLRPVEWSLSGFPETATADTEPSDVIPDTADIVEKAPKTRLEKWINLGLFLFGGLILARIIEAGTDFAKTVKGKAT